jgi:hypothetical protein
MSADRRGITEKSVYVHNPLPPIEDAEILAKAGLDDTAIPADLKPLVRDWTYGSGLTQEFLRLQPGERVIMRESDGNVCLKELKEQGVVIYAIDATPEQVKAACADGIRQAIVFYADRGNKRLTTLRKIHNYDRQAMEDNKHENWSFYYNQSLSEMLRAYLTKFLAPPKPAAPAEAVAETPKRKPGRPKKAAAA